MNGPEPGGAPVAVSLPDSPHREKDDRSRSPLALLADLAIAATLLLALLIVFLLDRDSQATGASVRRKYENYNTIFDPLEQPLAEVREFPKREQWIGGFGGSDKSEAAVLRGLEWLARHQAADGHWGPDCLKAQPAGRCLPADPCSGGGSEFPIAQTGLAILALQAAGHYDFNGNEYSAHVRRGLDWLLRNQQAEGRFVDAERGPIPRFMYEQGIAAFALADACEMAHSLGREPEDRYRQAAQQAIHFILYAQHVDGGWRYTDERDLPSDVSVSGWQVLALHAARQAKIVDVGQECIEQARNFFARCEIANTGRTRYQPGQVLSDATTGVGMVMHEFLLEQPDSALVKKGAAYLAGEAERIGKTNAVRPAGLDAANQDFYTWYNCTLAMYQAGGEPWKRWNNVVRDRVIGLQCRDAQSCAAGSWDPQGRWGPEGGRIYATALAVLTLEVYYRYKSQRAQVYTER